MKNIPQVFLLGANHKTAPIELRETLFIPEDRIISVLPEVRERHEFVELAVLSTCNRFELFGVSNATGVNESNIFSAYRSLHELTHSGDRFSEDQMRQATYLYKDDDAVKHIMKVASSLDSLVLGETQITGQFKDALQAAGHARTMGPFLTRLGQEALRIAKKVRTQTAIGRHHVSISHAAIELAQKVYGDLSDHKYLVVGAGEMARVACQYIMSYGPKEIIVVNRTYDRAAQLVQDLGFGQAYSMDELPNLICECDVVMSSTAAPNIVIDEQMIRRVQSQRRGKPLVLLDIAMPRDIEPTIAALEDVYLFDIDDLQQIVGANYEERRKAADEAMGIIDSGVAGYNKWISTADTKPYLAAFSSMVQELIQKELDRSMSRKAFKELSQEQKDAMQKMMESVGQKLTGSVGGSVLNPPEGYLPLQLADALGAIFGLEMKPEEESSPDEKVQNITDIRKSKKV